MTKKPAQLSENLLSLRPRKGEAKPQSEAEASTQTVPPSVAEPALSQAAQGKSAVPRRRKRRSTNTQQLNLRVSEKTLERFTSLADKENLIFGDLLEKLLNDYEER